ncbi:MAG: HD domain-containing protein [Anaerolineae bacterium]|nr:HD domain-containing protein [Anaerolineae bacterium]
MSELFYRVRQFKQAVASPALNETGLTEVQAILSDAEFDLFLRFDRGEQWHSYQVMRTLQEAGHTQPELLQAALLHDVGKTRSPLSVWDRSLIVVMKQVLPGKTAVWGQNPTHGWQRPFVVKAQHPEWGAEMAEAAGSRALVVDLIRRHQDDLSETAVAETGVTAEENELLRLLQWADNQN